MKLRVAAFGLALSLIASQAMAQAGQIYYQNSGGGQTPVSPSNPLPVNPGAANPATVYSAQQTATASAAALASRALANGLICKALSTNTGTIYVGPSGVTSATGYPLAAGEAVSFGVTNASAVYLLDSVTTDKLACVGN